MHALVLAFDGLIAETLDLRAHAIANALAEAGFSLAMPDPTEVAGRTLHEAIAALIGEDDPTLADMVTVRSQHEVSRRVAQGVSIAASVRQFIEAQRSSGARLVLRADSIRRDVERVLQLTELEYAFTFVRCADDLPRPRTLGLSALEGAYSAINDRLDALRIGERRALEYSAHAADLARRMFGQAESTQRLDVSEVRR